MAHYNSEPRDWFGGICVNWREIKQAQAQGKPVPQPICVGGVKPAKGSTNKQFGIRTLQQGVTQFSRKKKNGSKLMSSQAIRKAGVESTSTERIPVTTYKVAFPKMPI